MNLASYTAAAPGPYTQYGDVLNLLTSMVQIQGRNTGSSKRAWRLRPENDNSRPLEDDSGRKTTSRFLSVNRGIASPGPRRSHSPIKKISRYIFSGRRIFAWDQMKASRGPYRGGHRIRTRCFIKK